MALSQACQQYLDCIAEKIKTAQQHPAPVQQAAQLIYHSFCSGGFLYVFGTGHSHMFAEEVFYRAGGLARVKPMLDERLMLHRSASQSTAYERQSGLALELFQKSPLTGKDVLLIASNSGRNSVTIEMAQLARQAGAAVIALTSLRHSSAQASRHPSGKRLFELSDVVLDNFGETGDACVCVGGVQVAATSTVVGCALLEAVVAQVVQLGAQAGHPVETFASSNVDGGDAYNQRLIDRYKTEVPIL